MRAVACETLILCCKNKFKLCYFLYLFYLFQTMRSPCVMFVTAVCILFLGNGLTFGRAYFPNNVCEKGKLI